MQLVVYNYFRPHKPLRGSLLRMHTAYYRSFFLGSRFVLGKIAEFVQRPSTSSHNINSAYQPPKEIVSICSKWTVVAKKLNYRQQEREWTERIEDSSCLRIYHRMTGGVQIVQKYLVFSCSFNMQICVVLSSTVKHYFSASFSWRWWILTSRPYLPRDELCLCARVGP